MKRENWQKIKQIFNEALEVEPTKRKDFLAQVCKDNNDLRREVETLLRSFEDDFLERPAVEQMAEVIAEIPEDFQPDDEIGGYKILKKLGAGGQGTVFLAQDLSLDRLVAVKFLPTATDVRAAERFKREAQSAAALSHPHICAIHKIETVNGQTFLVMQYIEGETLSQKLKDGKLNLKQTLNITLQIADALHEAHTNGIVHRDIKPSNIIISPNGQTTVLDFGLAKLNQIGNSNFKIQAEESLSNPQSAITDHKLTVSGMILGTSAYMSPEQTRGETADARSDIWSLGVCLYEMLTGQNPFRRENMAETLAAVLSLEPDSGEIPSPVRAVVEKTLLKNKAERYQTIAELRAALKEIRRVLEFEEQLVSHELSLEKLTVKPPRRNWKNLALAGSIILVLGIGGLFFIRNRNLDRAHQNIGQVEALIKQDRTFEAYDLARQIRAYLPDDENLKRLEPFFTDKLTVKTEPAGVRVYLKRFQPASNGRFPEREAVGETPLENLTIPRGQFLLYLEKDGFAPFSRSISGRLPDYTTDLITMPPLEISVKMAKIEDVPQRMIFVPGSDYKLVSYTRPTEKSVWLNDFLIDKYEVSNFEFKEFITAGGYSKKEFWRVPFIKDGREIPFEEAVRAFRDRTGLAAPRSWLNQNFPEGRADFPVTDISWYEAAAYAEFRGKALPTVFQWEKAARDGKFDEGYDTMPWGLSRSADLNEYLANLRGKDVLPVENFEFGAGPFGCLNMAGNAAEWLLNKRGKNALTAGGAFDDLAYAFGDLGEYPLFYSSNRIGLRLVKNLTENANGSEDFSPAAIPDYQISSQADFKKWLTHYVYDRTPLEAETAETVETDSWTREKIIFVGANRERVIAYLYLPKNAPRPLQIVHWSPAADVSLGFTSLPHSTESFLTPVIKSGRAVFAVVLKGYHERPFSAEHRPAPGTSVDFRKEMIQDVTDWRRGLDYLETRTDLDANKIAFLGLSWGANQGLILTAVENRYRGAGFVGVGFSPKWKNWIAEANFVNFAPHITIPKLLLKGRYDEAHPLKTETEPLFPLLREPRRIVITESGHVPPPEIFAPIVNRWLDETLGKVFN